MRLDLVSYIKKKTVCFYIMWPLPSGKEKSNAKNKPLL